MALKNLVPLNGLRCISYATENKPTDRINLRGMLTVMIKSKLNHNMILKISNVKPTMKMCIYANIDVVNKSIRKFILFVNERLHRKYQIENKTKNLLLQNSIYITNCKVIDGGPHECSKEYSNVDIEMIRIDDFENVMKAAYVFYMYEFQKIKVQFPKPELPGWIRMLLMQENTLVYEHLARKTFTSFEVIHGFKCQFNFDFDTTITIRNDLYKTIQLDQNTTVVYVSIHDLYFEKISEFPFENPNST
jgi:hypothetical protein